jgi:F0F1-type ATP synthase delta subunit
MRKKVLQELVSASYTKNELDGEKVENITKNLKRKDLKSYIRALKLTEKKKHVVVALPSASVYNTTKQLFFDYFPDKKISVREDKLLLLGGEILADDMVYDFSLKNRLENFLDYLADAYDEE